MHVAAVAEQVGRAPQQLDAGPLLLFFEHLDDRVEIAVGLGEVRAFRGDVAIVERVERVAELLHELERHAGAVLGVLDRVGAVFPGPHGAAGAERIGARAAERVPVDDAEPQVVLHRLAADLFVGVVVAKRQRVLALGTFETDALDFGKCGHGKLIVDWEKCLPGTLKPDRRKRSSRRTQPYPHQKFILGEEGGGRVWKNDEKKKG